MTRRKVEALLEIPVSFGSVNIGDKTCRIGVIIARSRELSITVADRNLVEKRLAGKIVARPSGENADQGRLAGMDDVGNETLEGTFDVKGINVSKDFISMGLTFALASIDVSVLAHFAKRSGHLIVNEFEDLPDKPEKNGDGEDEEDGEGDEE